MGIATAASEAAPALLERAEQELESMLGRAAGLEPSAPDQADERRYYAASSMAAAYSAAIDDLRASLGLETHAAIAAAAREARNQAARAAAETLEVEEAASQAAIAAEEQAARTKACDAMKKPIFDSRGQRVFIATKSTYSEGRFSSLGGWNDGGDLIGRLMSMTAEDGRDVTGEVVSSPEGEFRLEQPSPRSHPSGGTIRHGGGLVAVATTATSEWLPEGAVVPEGRSEYQVAGDWAAADRAKADDALLADLIAMPESWQQDRASLLEAFADNPYATYGGLNGDKYSVRIALREDLDEHQAAQRAIVADKSARAASSPFAALAALRR
jgi:hypothetical protein